MPDCRLLHTALSFCDSQPLESGDYIAVGLAKCFKLNEAGKLDGACFLSKAKQCVPREPDGTCFLSHPHNR